MRNSKDQADRIQGRKRQNACEALAMTTFPPSKCNPCQRNSMTKYCDSLVGTARTLPQQRVSTTRPTHEWRIWSSKASMGKR